MHEVLPPWSFSVIVLAAYVAISAAQLKGVSAELGRPVKIESGSRPADGKRRRTRLVEVALVQAGVVTAMLAIVFPVGYWSGQYLWVRAIQDLMLCLAAPTLIVAGGRWLPTGRPTRTWAARSGMR